MKHTKLIALALAIILALTLSACGSDTPATTPSAAPATTSAAPDTPSAAPDTTQGALENATGQSPTDNAGTDNTQFDIPDDFQTPTIGLPPGESPPKEFFTLVCNSNTGFNGIAVSFTEVWGEDIELSNFDIEDLIVYVDGVANPVTDFRVVPWKEYDKGVAAYHIWFDKEFKENPAEFTVSVTIKGKELKQYDFPRLIADEYGKFTVQRH